MKDRAAGVLLAISSLPSKYGIGTLGKEAYHFVDQLAKGKPAVLAGTSGRTDQLRRQSVPVFFGICGKSVFY